MALGRKHEFDACELTRGLTSERS